MKENIIVTGNNLDEVVKSTNSIINSLVNRIIALENKIKNISGDSKKVENNTMRINSDKDKTYIDVTANNGLFRLELPRKE